MNIEEFRNYCLAKPGTTEEMPFGPGVLVFKVMGKMFALADIEKFENISLKCDPELAVELREQYDGRVIPGYHLHKKHWNTVIMDGSILNAIIRQWINHSYDLVVSKLPMKEQEKLKKKKTI